MSYEDLQSMYDAQSEVCALQAERIAQLELVAERAKDANMKNVRRIAAAREALSITDPF